MIKILIVDDSPTETAILKHILEENTDLQVIGCAKNGAEAVRLIPLLKPDLVTMDIQMPVMDGFEATRLILAQHPLPIVVISSQLHDESMNITFRALNAGALSVLAKPFDITSANFEQERRRIVETVRSMSEVKVIKRRILGHKSPPTKLSPFEEKLGKPEIIVIGASIGGTQALNYILSKLPANFPVPIVIVQHMMPGFIGGFAKWLNENTLLHAESATHHQLLKKGSVYFAPDFYHLEIQRNHNNQLMCKLVTTPPVSGFCPSITVLFQSVAKVCGKHAVGVLLTGMGSDGAEGLLTIKKAGGHTFIQDQKSSIVFGMAAVAQALGAVDKVVTLNQIADYLIKITSSKHH